MSHTYYLEVAAETDLPNEKKSIRSALAAQFGPSTDKQHIKYRMMFSAVGGGLRMMNQSQESIV